MSLPPREERARLDDVRSRPFSAAATPRELDREGHSRGSARDEAERPDFGRPSSRQGDSTSNRQYDIERRDSRAREDNPRSVQEHMRQARPAQESLRQAPLPRYPEESRSGRRSPPHVSRLAESDQVSTLSGISLSMSSYPDLNRTEWELLFVEIQ